MPLTVGRGWDIFRRERTSSWVWFPRNYRIDEEVFISYVRENSADIDRICNALLKNDIEYWIDREKIEPGKIWKQAIRNAINRGAFFLACFSKNTVKKKRTCRY